ncbi:hypothetical protein Q4543_23400, partial [Salipiger sp. 1_MG-2023]|nr:hypothetical protein [Salipiger sp. 1_MG-2023]
MTRATTTIPFSTIKFIDNIPRLSDLTERLTQKLREIRMELNQREPARITAAKAQSRYDRLCCTKPVRDSPCESSAITGGDEQTD